MRQLRDGAALAAALTAGLLIGWVDSRPSWDDTGITVGLMLLCAGALGASAPRRAWLLGLLVSAGVPAFELGALGGASLIVLAIGMAAACAGAAARGLLTSSAKAPR